MQSPRRHGAGRFSPAPSIRCTRRSTAMWCSRPRPAQSRSPIHIYGLAELGMIAANVMARAIARGVYEAAALPFAGALPSWKDKFGTIIPSFRDGAKRRTRNPNAHSRAYWIPGSRAAHAPRNDYARKRSARYGAGSQNGASPAIISAIMRPVAGPSVRPQCAWPTASQRPAWPGAGPITGRESGKAGRLPSQVLSSARSPSGNSSRAFGRIAVELHRRRRRVARGKFDAGGHADALFHRRDHIADAGVEHRPRQRGIALRAGSAGDSRA